MLIIDCGYWLCFVLGIGVLVEREREFWGRDFLKSGLQMCTVSELLFHRMTIHKASFFCYGYSYHEPLNTHHVVHSYTLPEG